MKLLFLCERPYPLYRTLLRAVNSNDEIDIVLSEHVDGMYNMYNQLKQCGLFKNVYYFDDSDYRHFLSFPDAGSIKRENIFDVFYYVSTMSKKFYQYLLLQHKAKSIKLPEGLDFNKYDEIYINECTSTLNFYLFSKKYHVICVEHGKNSLTHGEPLGVYSAILFILEKLRISYSLHGACRYVKMIEISENIHKIFPFLRNKEIRELSIHKLAEDLSPEQSEFIYQLYAKSYNINIPENSIVDIVLTGPAIHEKYEKREKIHQAVCKRIIRDFMSDADFIIIKPHPRDFADYSNICSNAIIIPSCISAEIFALSTSLKIRKAIAVISSTIHSFKNVQEHTLFEYEYIEKIIEEENLA